VRRRALVLLVLTLALALAGCGRAQGMSDTKDALGEAGYREVDVSLHTGGGIGVARVDAAPGGPPPERAAEVAWGTLPVRFDQLVVAVGPQSESYGYEALVARFGPRDPSLDRKQIDEKVVRDGLKLMLLLSIAAILSVGVVCALGFLVLRAARRATRQASADGDDSPTARGPSDASVEGPEAIPS
jgi:hypothetical protein